MAENFYNRDDFENSKKIYKNLEEYGSAFKWFSNKQISRILVKEEKEKEAEDNEMRLQQALDGKAPRAPKQIIKNVSRQGTVLKKYLVNK